MTGFLKTILMILVLVAYFLFIFLLSILKTPGCYWDEVIIAVSISVGLCITILIIKKIQPNKQN